MANPKIQKLNEGIDTLKKNLDEAIASGSAKDETIKRLALELAVAKEMLAAASKDPLMLEKMIVLMEKLGDKEFPKFPEELMQAGFEDLGAKLKLINEKEFPQPLDTVKISNLNEVPVAEEVKVIGLTKIGQVFTTSLTGLKKAITALASNVFKAEIPGGVKITNKELKDAIPVRLASKDLKFFYDVLFQVLGASGGGGTNNAILSEIKLAIEELGGSWYDRIDITYPDGDTEVYTYKFSGSTVQTITVNYTDATKEDLLSVIKT